MKLSKLIESIELTTGKKVILKEETVHDIIDKAVKDNDSISVAMANEYIEGQLNREYSKKNGPIKHASNEYQYKEDRKAWYKTPEAKTLAIKIAKSCIAKGAKQWELTSKNMHKQGY